MGGFALHARRYGGRRSRAVGLLAALALLVGALIVPQWVNAPKADAFGTVNGFLQQRAEHEMITRAALACGAGKKSDGSCFEPESLNQLAGHTGTFGAVGAPDYDEGSVPSAHCDDGDHLDTPGYPQDEGSAQVHLMACWHHLQDDFDAGVTGAGGLLGANNVLRGDQVSLYTNCPFKLTSPPAGQGTAKCRALEGLGRALHGVQDFYSHSNWTDTAAPGATGPTNPPGLGHTGIAPFMDLTPAAAPTPDPGLITGYYEGFFSDKCKAANVRVRHACLNKDLAKITVDSGADPVTYTVSDPLTVRGKVGDNEKKAVDAAVADTRRQWNDFRDALINTYGDDRGNKMILAITQDVPVVDLMLAVDTTGSMSPYINEVVAEANQALDDLSGGGSSKRLTDFRIGVVDYKDVDSEIPGCPPDYDAQTDLPFASTRGDITGAINSLPGKVSGGCDIPEDVLSGIQRAIDVPWRDGGSKSIIVMGDAPGHDPEPHSGLTSQSVIDAANAVDPASIYPILVGGDPDATAFMTHLAEGTGGKVFDSDTPGGVAQALIDAITAIAAAPPTGDTTPPAVQVALPTAPDTQGGVFNASQAPVTGTVSATDPSGVSAIDCTDDGNGLTLGPLTVDAAGRATRTLTVTGDGEHLVLCNATDASTVHNSGAADGSGAASGVVIDATAPTVACAVTPALITPADNALVPVTTTVSVADGQSGANGFTLKSVTSSAPGDTVQGFDTGTADTSGQVRAVPSALYTLTYEGTDAAGNTATCSAVVTVAAGGGGTGTITVDRTVNAVEKKSASPIVSPRITTSQGGELLLAFISADGPAGGTQQVGKVTGAGLTWTPAVRSSARGSGTAEVWQAYATKPVTAAAVTAALANKHWDGAITVVAYKGAAKTVGATAHTSGTKGAAKATITTTAAGSQLWAAGHDWSRAVHPVPLSGQQLATQNLDTRVADTYWAQYGPVAPVKGTPVTLGVKAQTVDRWELAAVEIRPATS